MKKLYTTLLILCLPVLFIKTIAQPLSGTYTIGGAGSNYTNLMQACNDLNLRGVSGPVVFNTTPSVTNYTSTIFLKNIAGSSSANTITINGNGDSIITGFSPAIAIEGCSYISLDSFTIHATPASYSTSAVDVRLTAEHISLKRLVIKDTHSPLAMNGRYSFLTHSQLYGPKGSSINGHKMRIENNYFSDFGLHAAGVTLSGDSIEFIQNTLMCNKAVAMFGINAIGSQRNYIKISGNRFLTSLGHYYNYGIELLLMPGKTEIINNLITNSRTGVECIGNGQSDSLFFYHNTVLSSASASNGLNLAVVKHINAYAIIKNNIFSIGSSASYGVSADTSNVYMDHNIYHINHSPGAGAASIRGTAYVTVAELKNIGKEINSLEKDPLFAHTATNNFAPRSITLDNKGASVGILKDINGKLRSSNTPDIGAYEYDSYPDIALTSAAISYSKNCYDSVFITVKNMNDSTINLSMLPLFIDWEVNGPANSSGTLLIANDSIAPLSSKIFAAGPAPRFLTGDYTAKAYISNSAYNNLFSNDTVYHGTIYPVNFFLAVIPKNITLQQPVSNLTLNVASPLFPVTSGFSWSRNDSVIGSTTTINTGPFNQPGVYKYVASLHHTCGVFYDTVTITAGTSVPVRLIDFYATKNRDNVYLKWSTATEKNVSHFEIFRSSDNEKWDAIDRIKATGNSNVTVNYNLTDLNVFKSAHSDANYKIRSVDEDGSFEWSKTLNVSSGVGTISNLVHPNPATDIIKINETLINANVSISTPDGISILNQNNPDTQKGINISQLPGGIYLISVTSENKTYVSKFVKQ